MRTWLILLTIFISFNIYAQDISRVKQIEFISEVSDTMALINKKDIDKIIKLSFEKEHLERVNSLNESLIHELEVKSEKLDSLIITQNGLIYDYKSIIFEEREKNNNAIKDYEKALKKSQRKKALFAGLSAGEAIAIVLLACFL